MLLIFSKEHLRSYSFSGSWKQRRDTGSSKHMLVCPSWLPAASPAIQDAPQPAPGSLCTVHKVGVSWVGWKHSSLGLCRMSSPPHLSPVHLCTGQAGAQGPSWFERQVQHPLKCGGGRGTCRNQCSWSLRHFPNKGNWGREQRQSLTFYFLEKESLFKDLNSQTTQRFICSKIT